VKNSAKYRILIIGFGNPGRLDDGLGPAFAEGIQSLSLPDVTVDADYQLTVEDAMTIAEHDVVIFADAAVSGTEPFFFLPVEPSNHLSFSTHSISPESLLGLVHDMFDSRSVGYKLGIRGYDFNEFGERLSSKASRNLDEALVFMKDILAEKDFAGAITWKKDFTSV